MAPVPFCGMFTFCFESMFAYLYVNLNPASQSPPANGKGGVFQILCRRDGREVCYRLGLYLPASA